MLWHSGKETKKRRYDEIKTRMTNAQQMSEEKVKLANDTYEMVDKHIRKLDADLARFEVDLKVSEFSLVIHCDVSVSK